MIYLYLCNKLLSLGFVKDTHADIFRQKLTDKTDLTVMQSNGLWLISVIDIYGRTVSDTISVWKWLRRA